MCSITPIDFSLEELVESGLLGVTDVHGQVLHCHTTSRIVLYRELFSSNSNIFGRGKEINHFFIINFNITDSDGHCLIKFSRDLMVDLLDSSGDDSSLLSSITLNSIAMI